MTSNYNGVIRVEYTTRLLIEVSTAEGVRETVTPLPDPTDLIASLREDIDRVKASMDATVGVRA